MIIVKAIQNITLNAITIMGKFANFFLIKKHRLKSWNYIYFLWHQNLPPFPSNNAIPNIMPKLHSYRCWHHESSPSGPPPSKLEGFLVDVPEYSPNKLMYTSQLQSNQYRRRSTPVFWGRPFLQHTVSQFLGHGFGRGGPGWRGHCFYIPRP